MKRWLADYMVESEIKLDSRKQKIIYNHPDKLFEVHISNATKAHPNEILSVQIMLDAVDVAQAEKNTQEALQKFLHLMSFVTQTGYKISRKICVIDWSDAVGMRDAYVYAEYPVRHPKEALTDSLFVTVGLIQGSETNTSLDMALRWFASGVRSKIMEDQFQFFWFVIELIATSTKNTNKVADRCPKCRGDLYCNTCQETPVHRPYDKQAIEALLNELKMSVDIIKDMHVVRNMLMHGEDRANIEKELQKQQPKFTFHRAVDIMGDAAWKAINSRFNLKDPHEKFKDQEFALLKATTFVDVTLSAKAHIQTVVGGELKIENLHLPQMSVKTE